VEFTCNVLAGIVGHKQATSICHYMLRKGELIVVRRGVPARQLSAPAVYVRADD
jgi:hypothetical protein